MILNLSFTNHFSGQRKIDLVVFHCHLDEGNMKNTCVGWRNSCEQFENIRMALSSMLGGAARAVQAVQVKASWIEESKALLLRCPKLWGGLSFGTRSSLLLEPGFVSCPTSYWGLLGTKHFYFFVVSLSSLGSPSCRPTWWDKSGSDVVTWVPSSHDWSQFKVHHPITVFGLIVFVHIITIQPQDDFFGISNATKVWIFVVCKKICVSIGGQFAM